MVWTLLVLLADLVDKTFSHSMLSYLRIGCSTVIHSHCRENDATERVNNKPIISLKGDKDSRIHIKG